MTVRWPTLANALWLGVHLVLLVTLGLGFVWPLVDPLAAERDPSHDHVVVGGTAAARARALAVHLHVGLAWHDHAGLAEPLDTAATDENSARVIVVGSHEGAAGGSLAQAAKTLALPLLFILAPSLGVFHTAPPRCPRRRSPALRRLDPPPRLLA